VHATIVRFAQTPYLRVALFLTVRRTYCADLLLTVHSVLCEERPASTTNVNFSRIFTEQCLRRLVTRRSMRRPEFHHRSVHVTFVVCKMELRRVSFPEHVGLFLSTSFTQCSMFILIYMLLIERRKPGKNRKKINDFSENEINI